MKKILITHAVEQEQVDLYIPDAEIRMVLTGVGKANAAMNLTAAIMEDKPDLVLNVGTAGTLKHQVGDIFMCHQFLDRDLISLKLNGVIAELQTAVPEWVSPCSWVGQRLVTGDFYVNTGDDFVTAHADIQGDVVDMEGFAEALVCCKMGVPLIAVKYVTDVIGCNSVKLWEDKLCDARKEIKAFFEKNALFLSWFY